MSIIKIKKKRVVNDPNETSQAQTEMSLIPKSEATVRNNGLDRERLAEHLERARAVYNGMNPQEEVRAVQDTPLYQIRDGKLYMAAGNEVEINPTLIQSVNGTGDGNVNVPQEQVGITTNGQVIPPSEGANGTNGTSTKEQIQPLPTGELTGVKTTYQMPTEINIPAPADPKGKVGGGKSIPGAGAMNTINAIGDAWNKIAGAAQTMGTWAADSRNKKEETKRAALMSEYTQPISMAGGGAIGGGGMPGGGAMNTINAIGDAWNKIAGAAQTMGTWAADNRNKQEEASRAALMNEYTQPIMMADGGMSQGKPVGLYSPYSMTGEYLYPLPKSMEDAANAEIEKGEYVITPSPDNAVMEAQGERHSKGGTQVNLEEGTRVISDQLTIGKDFSKVLKNNYGIRVLPNSTYSTCMDRYKTKIGLKKQYEDMERLMRKLEHNELNVKDDNTKTLNESVLSKYINDLQVQIDDMEMAFGDFADVIYKQQQKQKDEEDIQLYFGEGGKMSQAKVLDLASKYGISKDEAFQRALKVMREKYPKDEDEYEDGGEIYLNRKGLPMYKKGVYVPRMTKVSITPPPSVQDSLFKGETSDATKLTLPPMQRNSYFPNRDQFTTMTKEEAINNYVTRGLPNPYETKVDTTITAPSVYRQGEHTADEIAKDYKTPTVDGIELKTQYGGKDKVTPKGNEKTDEKTKRNRMPWAMEGFPFYLPPSAPEAAPAQYLETPIAQTVTQSYDPYIKEISRSVAQAMGSLQDVPTSQQGAIYAALNAGAQEEISKAIAQVDAQNMASQVQTSNYNDATRMKVQQINNTEKARYQDDYYAAKAAYEENFNRLMDQINTVKNTRARDRRDLNIIQSAYAPDVRMGADGRLTGTQQLDLYRLMEPALARQGLGVTTDANGNPQIYRLDGEQTYAQKKKGE